MHSLSRRDLARIALLVGVSPLVTSFTALATEESPLAMKGYDPVAYFTEKRAMVGDPQYQHEWDGHRYRFASAKHLELFKADPERYLPQYSTWCAAALSQGFKVPGNPEYWLVVDGRLYLFSKPIGPERMKADPVVMKTKADENWPKVAKLPDPPSQ